MRGEKKSNVAKMTSKKKFRILPFWRLSLKKICSRAQALILIL